LQKDGPHMYYDDEVSGFTDGNMTLAAPPRKRLTKKPGGQKFTAAEFFAGIGLVRLALERQG